MSSKGRWLCGARNRSGILQRKKRDGVGRDVPAWLCSYVGIFPSAIPVRPRRIMRVVSLACQHLFGNIPLSKFWVRCSLLAVEHIWVATDFAEMGERNWWFKNGIRKERTEDAPVWVSMTTFISHDFPSSVAVRPKIGLTRKFKNVDENQHTPCLSFLLTYPLPSPALRRVYSPSAP